MKTKKSNQKDTNNKVYALLENEIFTGFYDDNKQPIFVGDKLKNEWDYEVIVVKDDDDYIGKLVCDDKDSCKNIPYALNKGKGYIKIKK